ncbi:MAG TPA: DUF6151 family protein [Steroidobacter sp.]|uniref:DUF6151 family protein n=1 Tax=Steroidobacter sp. TaxID=1978227 RepID=UPI002ED8D4BF
MEIQCECGAFRAQLGNFPRNTPGRLACYCDDCQVFAQQLQRADLLDSAGGTEVIPVYPADLEIVAGREVLKCLRLSPNGLYRWYAGCCNTPLANVKPGFPWVGLVHRVFTVEDSGYLERTFGAVRARVMGRYARGTAPSGTADKVDFKGFMAAFPFILKGLVTGKARPSPFFAEDGQTPIVSPIVLSLQERNAIRQQLGF